MEKKMDYFYTPYRKDFIEDAKQYMTFEETNDKRYLIIIIYHIHSILHTFTNFIFKTDSKPFEKTILELNKIKKDRLKWKLK